MKSSTTDASVSSSDATTTIGGTQETTSTGDAPLCDPVVPGEFARCFDGVMYDGTLCNWMGTSESVGTATCLMAAGGEGRSVCMISGCEERCDCFAAPPTGTASVECMEGIIAEQRACVLYCGAGEVCPDGMVCGFDICVWEPE